MSTCSKGCVNFWGDGKSLLAKFSGHRPYCSRGITDLIFLVTFQDYVIKRLCEFINGGSLFYTPILQRLVVTGIAVADI